MREKRNSPAYTKVREKGWGASAPGARAEILLQPVDIMMKQVIPLQSMEDDGGANMYTAACGFHTAVGECALKEDRSSWRAHSGAGS